MKTGDLLLKRDLARMAESFASPAILERFDGVEVTAIIRARHDVAVQVEVWDTDAGRMVPMMKIFPSGSMDDAVAYARLCAEMN